ncbi:MAG: pyridoxamine 5'-phosphate oxidase family protein [Alphaproteobacteria bacterium]|nr:pyridoxamine 5'-phosphate oxidase family protein [Alphaproteobacteria bacterium]MCW5742026.1 pyridoxamine 5'-phosphate oxidase family protein [Alphaproteobacteria bacterium]
MSETIDALSPFHAGEREAQRRANVPTPHTQGIRPFMPEQHRDFFALLPCALIAARDRQGWPVPTMLAGLPGFISSPDPTTLRVSPVTDSHDPVRGLLTPGDGFGLLGIDFSTRRRNRANGRVAAADEGSLTLAVEQSFGNCPQYINLRDATWHGTAAPSLPEHFTGLDDAARALIGRADTFFVASGSESGLDISHRGGPRGLVQIEGDQLAIPDYRGNRFFNTLGNLLLDPRASLLFVDFERGDTLVVRGRVEIEWTAQRLWRLRVEDGWWRRGALPLRWTGRAA